MKTEEQYQRQFRAEEHYRHKSMEVDPPWEGARAWDNRHKLAWPDGPWRSEPDKVQWRHAGLDCLSVRNRSDCWCGYVGVPEGHPLHGKDYGDVDVEVHGGLTFSGRCREGDDPGRGICHVAGQEVWWLGFDCHHGWDLSPFQGEGIFKDDWAAYRDLDYVRWETERLAEQIAGCEE